MAAEYRMTDRVLDREFNEAVLAMTRRLFPQGYVVSDDAPASLHELTKCIEDKGRMAVSRHHSENTIFGDPEINWAFRAWHDWTHWRYQLDFTPAGEREVCRIQQRTLEHFYGAGAQKVRRWCRVLDAEINGQVAYEARFNEFPPHQFALTLSHVLDAYPHHDYTQAEKEMMYAAFAYECDVPPVCTAGWTEQNWIAHVARKDWRPEACPPSPKSI